jgi:periplasmic protein CpxP/Spy
MEKTKLLTISVIGLLLLNMALMAFLWFGKGGDNHPRQPEGKQAQTKALNFLMDELKFDPSQRAACDLLLTKQRQDMDSLQKQNRQNRNNLFDNIKTGDTTASIAIANTQRQLEMSAFNYFRNIRALCRPEQLPKFDTIISEAMRMMGPIKPPAAN